MEDDSLVSCQDLPPTFDFGTLVVYKWVYELVSSQVCQWVNTSQLLIIFQQQTGYVGLKPDPKGRLYHQISKWEAGQEYLFLDVAGDFGIFLRALLKRVGALFEFKKRRPSRTSFGGWTNCVRFENPDCTRA